MTAIPSRTRNGLLFRIVGLLVIAFSFSAAWLITDFKTFRQSPLNAGSSGFDLLVSPGGSLNSIAKNLTRQGALKHPYYLIALGRYLRLDAKIQAGEYHIEAGTAPEELLEQLTSGKVMQHIFTLIEGHTFREMMRRISEDPVLVQTLNDRSAEHVMAVIGYPGLDPEGRFLPETFHFPRGTEDVKFLRRAFLDMDRFLQQSWEGRDKNLPLKSPYEALILASIIEKETGVAGERARIAGVFIRRLKKNMRLQTDPTVIYGLGSSFDGDIRFRDLRNDTPYNTYTRFGLPPTPIAMPGKDAILAAVHPADGNELYFVARGDGSHQFSATLQEHNRAVNRFQRKR